MLTIWQRYVTTWWWVGKENNLLVGNADCVKEIIFFRVLGFLKVKRRLVG